MYQGCSCLTIIVGIVLIHISKAALPTGCTSGTPTCPGNSACKRDACVCNDGFKLDSTKNGCEAKVFGDSCDSTNGCTGLLNTACTNSKCECAAGYANKNSVCTKVIGGSCSGTAACPGDVNTICKNSLCACADDYVEKTNVCTKRNFVFI
ncbi:prion-like-(Q/N-rich) domain-bearing protein 25 [Ruditapes philippinarum]|uniref:prion-like-(Q/N-rich) domain-bearing protein 25 n=1 Tax=Ruditapes philippinarum TaxID=129788 RepID=UPI00295B8D0C|nr:prion-like-(Q/N-rich) domain-bearing protein 25 [Ruditapes philippinarum]